MSTHCALPLADSSGFVFWVCSPPPGGFNLLDTLTPHIQPNFFTLGALLSMAEGVRPEDYCDEPVEDEFGEIIKCRSGKVDQSLTSVCLRGVKPGMCGCCCVSRQTICLCV